MATTVLLGVADSVIRLADDQNVGWNSNKFGGKANWMSECYPDNNPRCDICQGFLCNVAQIYCPLNGSEYHRTLNIFGCISFECQNKAKSWKVLRSQCKEKSHSITDIAPKKEKEGENISTWCDGADDWGDDSSDCEAFDTMFKDLSMTESSLAEAGTGSMNVTGTIVKEIDSGETARFQPPSLPSGIPYLTPFFVNVVEEPNKVSVQCLNHEENLLKEYEQREGPLLNLNRPEKSTEKYEKYKTADGDRTFYQFQKRIQRCPGQCLRYEWNGTPLPFSDKADFSDDINNIPVCSNCQSPRVFEMQLMPALSWALQVPSEIHKPNTTENSTDQRQSALDLNGRKGEGIFAHGSDLSAAVRLRKDCTRIEFGCLFIYSCSKSCNKTEGDVFKPVEEFVVFQPFPDNSHIEKVKEFGE